MSTLTPQAIQDAALAIVDESGAHKLTMRAVARRLDVEAPSLYYHVANKSALVDRIVDSILGRVELPEPGPDGTDGARGLAFALRTELSAHPNAVPLVASRPAHTLALVDRCEALRDALVRGGLSPTSATHLLRSLVVFTIGHAAAASSVGPDADAWFRSTVDALIAGARLAPGADASIAATGHEAAASGAK
ncbi:MAG: TetR family transcriptional regulator, partial [Deltaproteobacteria bacterium]